MGLIGFLGVKIYNRVNIPDYSFRSPKELVKVLRRNKPEEGVEYKDFELTKDLDLPIEIKVRKPRKIKLPYWSEALVLWAVPKVKQQFGQSQNQAKNQRDQKVHINKDKLKEELELESFKHRDNKGKIIDLQDILEEYDELENS